MTNDELMAQMSKMFDVQNAKFTDMLGAQDARVSHMLDAQNAKFTDMLGAQNERVSHMLDAQNAKVADMLDAQDVRASKMLGAQDARVSDLLETQTVKIAVLIENTVTKRLDALFDGYVLTHEKQWELERKFEALEDRILLLENQAG